MADQDQRNAHPANPSTASLALRCLGARRWSTGVVLARCAETLAPLPSWRRTPGSAVCLYRNRSPEQGDVRGCRALQQSADDAASLDADGVDRSLHLLLSRQHVAEQA